MELHKKIARALALNSSLGRSLTFFMAILVVAGMATSAWTLSRSWERAMYDTQRDAMNLSVSQARQAEDTFLQTELVLRDIRRNLPAQGVANLDVGQFDRYLSELQRGLPQLHGLLVYNPLGHMVSTSFGKIPPVSINSDREYFIYHQRHNHGSLHISHVIRSRSTGDLVIPVSLRINNAEGRFAGVLLATVKIDYFRHFYSYFELQNRDMLALLNTDGAAVYVRPYGDEIINRNFSQSPLFSTGLSKRERGTATWVSPLDKVERIYGFARLERYPLVVAAGYDKRALWHRWLRDSMADLMLNVMLLLGTLLMGIVIFRQVRTNVRNQAELALLRDELTSINHTLQLMALADGLTGLANRRQFDLYLSQSVKASAVIQKPVALIMIDIDFFKRYNDCYGHVAGDDCLRRVGAIIQKLARGKKDLVARYGGEEFAIILPGTGQQEALRLAQLAVDAVRKEKIPHQQSASALNVVTISAGCYSLVCSTDFDEVVRLKEGADRALYQAKVEGRDRAVAASQ